MNKLLMAVAGICVSFSAGAVDFSLCDVREVVAVGAQNGHAQLSCTVSNVPACAVSNNYVAVDRMTTEGRQYFAMLITAQATGAKVSGDIDRNACPAWQTNVALLKNLRMQR